MTRRLGAVGLAAALSWAPASAAAQSGGELLERAVAAYRTLDLTTTTGLVRRALALTGDGALTRDQRLDALALLGASEHFLDRPDSAVSTFRQLVLASARFRPDAVVFPPPVLALFDDARRSVKAVEAVPGADTVIGPGVDTYAVRLHATSFHEISSRVIRSDGAPVRDLYVGPIGDSLDLQWDGMDADGRPVPTGSYYLSIASRAPDGAELRSVRVPLQVTLLRRDTLPLPLAPPDSVYLPEHAAVLPGVRSLLGGAVLAGAAIALPNLLGAGGEGLGEGVRFAVGGSVAIAGAIGFVLNRPGRSLPANIDANGRRRRVWRAQRDAVAQDNAARLRDVRLSIRAAPPVPIEPRDR